MRKKKMSEWFKGFAIGSIGVFLALAITFSMPYNETRILIENGFNPFWALTIVAICLFIIGYLILRWGNRKEEEKEDE